MSFNVGSSMICKTPWIVNSFTDARKEWSYTRHFQNKKEAQVYAAEQIMLGNTVEITRKHQLNGHLLPKEIYVRWREYWDSKK